MTATGTGTDTRTLLAVEDVEVAYGRAHALFGVSLAVPVGGAMAVLGFDDHVFKDQLVELHHTTSFTP